MNLQNPNNAPKNAPHNTRTAWLRNAHAATRGWRGLRGCLLSFCVGVIALRWFSHLPPLLPLLGFTAGFALLGIRWTWLRPLSALVLGLGWASVVASALLGDDLPRNLQKKDVLLTGSVVGTPTVSDYSQRFEFKVQTLTWQGESYPAPQKIRLTFYQTEPAILSGERWQFTARLKQPRGYQNPNATFDYEAYLLHHRIRARGYVRARPPPQRLSSQAAAPVSQFRYQIAQFIKNRVADGAGAQLLPALSVGLRSQMSPHTREVLLRTGTVHLVAISGLHIGLVAGLVLLLGSWCWRFAGAAALRLPAPKVGVLAGLAAGWGYAVLAGMTIPTQRAACMLTVVALALFFRRRAFGSETLLLALVVVLAVDPLAPLSGGFWLSFGAVLILGIAAHATRVKTDPDAPSSRKWLGKVRMWWLIQWALFVGMLPVLLVMFQQVSLVAPVANLVAVPVVGGVVVPLALLGLSLAGLGLETLAGWVFVGAAWLLDGLWYILEALAGGAWSVWQPAVPPLWALPWAAVGVLLWLAPRAVPGRWSAILWLLPLFISPNPNLKLGEFRYTMLEVGQGLASVVQTRNRVLVYDAGPRYHSGYDSGQAVVVPFLRTLGLRRLDALVVSHGDNDHSGGYAAVATRYAPARILTSAAEKIPNAQSCQAGQTWHWDGVRFAVLWPPADTKLRGNQASCVVKITSRYGGLLLSGDIGERAEYALLNRGANLAAEVLQVPHHGSKTSSSAAFLERVNPRFAINSAGYLNRFGHPHEVVRRRYIARRIPVYHTAEEGALRVDFLESGIELRGTRGQNPKYWTQPPKNLRAPKLFLGD